MKSVAIVGAGALGSHLILLARNWDVDIRVIDFDRVEAKNVQSQFHTKMGQGKNKAKALQSAMQGLFQRKLMVYPVRLEDSNAALLLGGVDLVVDCTDNKAARILIQNVCGGRRVPNPHREESHVPCLHGCLSADGTLARVVWTEHFEPDDEGTEGAETCMDGENLPFHVMASAMIAQVVQRYLESGVKQSWQITPFTVTRLV